MDGWRVQRHRRLAGYKELFIKTQARRVANKGTVEQCDWKELKRYNAVQLASIFV